MNSLEFFICKIELNFIGNTQRSPSREQFKLNEMNIKVLAGYNRFKSDNVFFRQVENTQAMIEYENMRFRRFLIYNSSRVSTMIDIENQIRHQFSVNNLIWKCPDFFRGKTQRSPSQEQSKYSNLNLQIVAVSNRL